MNILWWHWLVIGLVMIGLELFIPSFTIIWFGLGAVLVGIVMAIYPGFPLPAQLLTWTVVSVALTFAWFRYFNPRKDKTFAGSAQGAVVGETGLVIRAAEPYARGVVKFQLPLLGADEWPCLADEPLAIGDRVKVIDVEGHVMKVEKIKKGEGL
jgi:membrane protein implicated in regulation of membrane protease activity